MTAPGWSAFATAIPAQWLHSIFKKNKDTLFSANVRGYLGSRKSDSNINQNIKSSASSKSENFWAYNNGVTALVNDFTFEQVDSTRDGKLKLFGISIVNGAQTTGAIGSLSTEPPENAYVPARFIKCSDKDTVRDITRFNNSQNKVEAADFRSNDKHQERLRAEFKTTFQNFNYRGGRRGGAEDKILRPSNLLASDTAAQILASFHQNPALAYHDKSSIWESDDLYSRFFNESTRAEHIVFLYCLHEAIKLAKSELMNRSSVGQLGQQEKTNLEFLRHRGSAHLLLAAFGATMETILGKAVPSLFFLSFKTSPSMQEGAKRWAPLVGVHLNLSQFLLPALKDGLRKREVVEHAIKSFSSIVAATAVPVKPIYDAFANEVNSPG